MGFIRQTGVCIILGLVLWACQASGNENILTFTDKIQDVVSKDYSVSDVKAAGANAIKSAASFTENLGEAIKYTEEVLASYRKESDN